MPEKIAPENPCNLCGGAGAVVVGHKGRFDVPLRNVMCLRCTLVWVDPRPGPEALAAWYGERYHDQYSRVGLIGRDGSVVAPGTAEHERLLREGLQARLDAITRWTEIRTMSRPRVLEVGCRDGRLLRRLRDTFQARVQGVEPSVKESALCVARGVPCFTGTLEDFSPPDEPYDVVLLFHVLEHVADPLAALEKLRTLLAADGALVIEVPNLYRPYGSLEDNFFQDAHLYTFSPRTLGWLLNRAGLQPKLSAREVLFSVSRIAEPFEPDYASGEGSDWVLQHLAAYRRWHRLTTLLGRHGYDDRVEAACRALEASPGGAEYKRHAFLRVGCAAVSCGSNAAGRHWLERLVELGDRDPDVATMLSDLRRITAPAREARAP